MDGLKISDLVKMPAEVLGQMLLVDVEEVFEFDKATQKRTNTVSGFRYNVVLSQIRFVRLGVRIDIPKKLMAVPEGEFIEVNFTDLELSSWHDEIRGKATGITKVQNKQ